MITYDNAVFSKSLKMVHDIVDIQKNLRQIANVLDFLNYEILLIEPLKEKFLNKINFFLKLTNILEVLEKV